MNQNFKKLLDLYLEHSLIQKEISNFACFYEENQAKFDLVPSLTHTENLLKDLNSTHLPSLITQFNENNIAKKADESCSCLAGKVAKINDNFEEKIKQSDANRLKRSEQLENYIQSLKSQ